MAAPDLAPQTSQSAKQASIRAVTSTANTYEGDWHALFDRSSIPVGTFDERLLRYLNVKLAATYTSLPEAQQAFAAANGAANWTSLGTFSAATTAPVTVILLWAGQSNAEGASGAASLDPALDTSDPNILEWPYAGGPAIVALDGFLHWPESPGAARGPSPCMSAARTLLPTLPPGSQIVIIPAAYGGTQLYNDTWASPSGTLYLNAKNALTACLAAYPGATVLCSWQQGEADAKVPISASNYSTALQATVAGWRSVAGAENMPFVIGSMVPEWTAMDQNYREIGAVHQKTPLNINNCFFVHGPTGYNDVSALNIHYLAPGLRIIGPRIAGAFNTALALTSAVPTTPGNIAVSGTNITFTVPTTNAVCYVIETRPDTGTGSWLSTVVYPTSYALPGDTMTFGIPGGGVRDVRVKARAKAGDSSYTSTVRYTPASFNPATDLTTTVTWFNPRDNTKNFSDAGTTQAVAGSTTVRQVNSSIGSYTLSQATSGNRPSYVNDAISGQKVWDWVAASSKKLECVDAGVLATTTGSDNGFTIVSAVRRGAPGVSATHFSLGLIDGSGTTNGMRFYTGSGNGFGSQRAVVSTNYFVNEPSQMVSGAADTWYVVTYCFSGTEMIVRLNGVQIARGNMDSASVSFTKLTLGAYVTNGGSSFYSDGAGGDFFIMDDTTPGSQIAALEDYLCAQFVMPQYAA